MIVEKIKILTLDDMDYVAEKGKIFFDGVVEQIKINLEVGLIKIKFENNSDWEETIFVINNLKSYTYSGRVRNEIPIVIA